MLSQQNVKIYNNSHIFYYGKIYSIWDKTCQEKHNGNIFETFEASLVVLSITRASFVLQNCLWWQYFLFQILPKINRLPPIIISMTVQSLKTVGQSNLDLQHTQALETRWQTSVLPFNHETNTENLNRCLGTVLLF